jgi:triphosphoribosyl-dephospho-CoA synthetase
MTVTDKVSEEISQTVIMKKKLTDADLRKAVQRYNDELTARKGSEGV